jgi:hypothetical protein
MEKYISECIDNFNQEEPKDKLKPASTHANNYLLKTRQNSVVKLLKSKASLFHSTVAKLLFVAKRGRPDILRNLIFDNLGKRSTSRQLEEIFEIVGISKTHGEVFFSVVMQRFNRSDMVY